MIAVVMPVYVFESVVLELINELRFQFRYKLLFPLGFDLNANVSESILEEAKKHGDILQGNFHDRFDTLTEKVGRCLVRFHSSDPQPSLSPTPS